MERNNQNVLMALIAIVIVIAVFSSFGLSLFQTATPTITLPTPLPTGTADPEQPTAEREEGTRVEITPTTVQSTIAALNRIESYYRTVTTTQGGASSTAQVWVDGGWSRSDLRLYSGMTAYTIVGDGTVWRWYSEEPTVVTWDEEEDSADLDGQRIPTYEDVLELPMESITAARYEQHDGYLCVFVEVDVAELMQKERYWVSVDSGLLAASEIEQNGEIVWSMATTEPEIPIPLGTAFRLPDGTELHHVGELEGDL